MRNSAWLVIAVLVCLDVQGADDYAPSEKDMSPAVRRAVQAGLDYLARSQNADGSWMSDGRAGSYPVAMTSLAGLALMSDGNTPSRGRYSRQVRQAVVYLVESADPRTGVIRGRGEEVSMHGHGFALLFLGEACGSEPDDGLGGRVRAVLTRGVDLTARAQTKAGGWYYTPDSTQDEGSVTVTQIQGLRACVNAGIYVPKETIDRAVQYIALSANPDGGIRYSLRERGEGRPPITCAAIATLYNAGRYESPIAERARAYAARTVWPRHEGQGVMGHFFYAHLYLAQVLYRHGGKEWRAYYEYVSAQLLKQQKPDGSIPGDYVGSVYGTSVALIILQMPRNSLPILQP